MPILVSLALIITDNKVLTQVDRQICRARDRQTVGQPLKEMDRQKDRWT